MLHAHQLLNKAASTIIQQAELRLMRDSYATHPADIETSTKGARPASRQPILNSRHSSQPRTTIQRDCNFPFGSANSTPTATRAYHASLSHLTRIHKASLERLPLHCGISEAFHCVRQDDRSMASSMQATSVDPYSFETLHVLSSQRNNLESLLSIGQRR